jgi:benzoyl-CoA reductase subunit B
MHGKWYQLVSEYKGIPYFSIDMACGIQEEMAPHRQEYLENQCFDAIEWMEEVTSRKFDDEKFIKAVYTDSENMSLWSKICELNKNIPAPLEEKTMYSLYVLNALDRTSEAVTEFYRELLDEVKYRVENQIAAVPTERFRFISDSQPPWSFLKIFRYLKSYGGVSVGSFYTFCLMSAWDVIDGHLVAPPSLREEGKELKTREEAVKTMVEIYTTRRPIHDNFTLAWPKSACMLSMVKDWRCDGAIMHFNRGCEGTSLGNAENRLALLKEGIPVVVYEGNMGDEREFDAADAMNRVDAFLESLGAKKLLD